MKVINQLIHCTKTLDNLKSILQNGIHPSYAKEVFNNENILIPMISFSNILFRDMGSDEVVSYGDYGIVIERELAYKYELNPVMYVIDGGLISTGVKENFYNSIIPQVLEEVKKFYKDTENCCGSFLENVKITPLSDTNKSLINYVDENTDDDLIQAIKNAFGDIFENTNKQILLMKSYKVHDKNGKEWIAYNEREWRRIFFDLHSIREFTPKGEKNSEYNKWEKERKPHLKDDKYTLKIDLKDIKHIIELISTFSFV